EELQDFWTNAQIAFRAHAIEFLGQVLSEKGNEFGEDEIERVGKFWDTRLSDAKHTEVLFNFGWLFVSRRFPDSWALEHLEKTLKLAGKIEPDYGVVKQLNTLFEKHSEISLRCLEIILKDTKANWRLYEMKDDIRSIL